MKTDQPLFLNEEQVREYLRMTELIPAMEKALVDFSAGKVTQPVRSIISVDVAAATGFLGLMPALTPDGLGLKAVTFYPSNAERGIPTHMATIKSSPFSAAGCKRAAMSKLCGSLGNLRRFASGVRRLNTQSGSQTKLARQQCPPKKRYAAQM